MSCGRHFRGRRYRRSPAATGERGPEGAIEGARLYGVIVDLRLDLE